MKISSVERRDDRLVLVFDSISATADRYCVLARVNAVDAETSKATVYNTLKLFVESGLVREVIVEVDGQDLPQVVGLRVTVGFLR